MSERHVLGKKEKETQLLNAVHFFVLPSNDATAYGMLVATTGSPANLNDGNRQLKGPVPRTMRQGETKKSISK